MEVGLGFHQEVDGLRLPGMKTFKTAFYEAYIKIDAILSYPWMRKNELGVFPHLGALVMDKPKMALLYGMEREGRKWSKDNRESYGKSKN